MQLLIFSLLSGSVGEDALVLFLTRKSQFEKQNNNSNLKDKLDILGLSEHGVYKSLQIFCQVHYR